MNCLAVLCTDGILKLKDINRECKKERWFPILVYRVNGETVVPLFDEDKTVLSFIKRNLPDNWEKGRISLTDEDIKSIKSKGWTIREMNYPHKISNYEIGFEVLHLSDEPEMTGSFI